MTMSIFEAGRQTQYLNDILDGTKTVEGRLNRGKFSRYTVGDLVYLREDLIADGIQVGTIPSRALVEITSIGHFDTFRTMLEHTTLARVLPRCESIEAGVSAYHQIYTAHEEAHYGVVAIHFKLLAENPDPPSLLPVV